jgi:hypothetical protein
LGIGGTVGLGVIVGVLVAVGVIVLDGVGVLRNGTCTDWHAMENKNTPANTTRKILLFFFFIIIPHDSFFYILHFVEIFELSISLQIGI